MLKGRYLEETVEQLYQLNTRGSTYKPPKNHAVLKKDLLLSPTS